MARQVISTKDLQNLQTKSAAPGSAPEAITQEADSYTERLIKYIPAEIVAVFILVQGLVQELSDDPVLFSRISWGIFILFCILTPLYLLRLQGVKKVTQLIISILAFAVWVFALGGPFATLGWYNPLYGQILLPIFTILIAIVVAEN